MTAYLSIFFELAENLSHNFVYPILISLNKQKKKLFVNICITLFLLTTGLYPLETINRIYAVVGNKSITELDYEKGEEKYNKLFKTSKSPYKGSHKTQVLDFLISKAVIEITAEEETITVNEKRVESEIDKIMENSGNLDRASFEKFISEKTGLPFDIWVSELPHQIMKNQLMQVRVPVKAPSEDEIQKWYQLNKAKVGFEFKYREIVISPKNGSIEEETRVLNEIKLIQKELRKDKSSFNLIASSPRNNSTHRNGIIDWTPIGEIYKNNKFTANYLMQVESGTVTDVFRDEKNRYCIIKSEGKRSTPIELLRRYIQQILQGEKVEESFDEWIRERRKELTIYIYDKEYLTENKLDAPDESFNMDKVRER